MAIVVLLDQRNSRSGPDLLGPLQESLNEELDGLLALPFTRTIGDEMQAVLGDPRALGRIARQAFASRRWWMGVGVGEAEAPLPADPREARGPAFYSAREAIGRAKARRGVSPIAVLAPNEDDAASTAAAGLTECLEALAFIVTRRTEKQSLVADSFYSNGHNIDAVIEQFGLTPQGARQRLIAAGAEEEKGLISLAARLAKGAIAP